MPKPKVMHSKEFEIVRHLIAGRESPWPDAVFQHRGTLTPAPFREIDGKVLARQYVAYRKVLEEKAQALESDGEAVLAGSENAPELRGEWRPVRTGADASSGWFSGFSRLWRR